MSIKRLIKNVYVENDTITFDVAVSATEANKLRQIFLTKIPTMAIDEVHIYFNDSVMPDDFLIHRLQMIPILVDSCQFGEDDFFNLIIDKKGGIVMSDDIKGEFKAMSNIVCIKLNDDQRFFCEAVVRKGTAAQDPRWAAVSAVGFKKNGNVFTLTVESLGVYKPEELLETAIVIFDN